MCAHQQLVCIPLTDSAFVNTRTQRIRQTKKIGKLTRLDLRSFAAGLSRPGVSSTCTQ
jgi:hypothetical protein